MKKTTIFSISSLFLMGLLAGGQEVFAGTTPSTPTPAPAAPSALVDGKVGNLDYKSTYKSANAKDDKANTLTRDAVVGFVLDPNSPVHPVDPSNPTNPLNPMDPTDPTKPDDPTNPKLPGTNGLLSLDYASIIDFGAHQITTADSVYPALQDIMFDPKDNSKKEVADHIQVSDRREDANRDGWHLTVKQSGDFTNGKSTLKGAQVIFDEVSATSTNAASLVDGKDITVPSQAVTVNNQDQPLASQDKTQDIWGTYIEKFGKVNINIPGAAEKIAGTYQASFIYSLAAKPATK
jgi:hypothetical protein